MLTDEREKIKIYVLPNSRKVGVCGEMDGCIKIKIKSKPIEGQANKELLQFLSELGNCPKSAIEILQGSKGRIKIVLGPKQLRQALDKALQIGIP